MHLFEVLTDERVDHFHFYFLIRANHFHLVVGGWESTFTFFIFISIQVLRNDIEVLAEEAEKEIRTHWNMTNRSHVFSRSPPHTNKNVQGPEGANFRDSGDAEEVGKAAASPRQGQTICC